ncbi:MAG: Curli production assembly/transport component CsgG [Bryobacterales bacterium]|nr:Curli production assembly/transport component CsgG [Bryobacterales bacterium]
MKKVIPCIAALLYFAPVSHAQTAPKKRIAIMNFDYGTVQSNVNLIFGGAQDIGKGIADLVVDRLVNDGRYSVIERKAIDKIMAEQNFSNSDRADPNSAAKLGRLLGVDAIVIGSITQFGRDDKNTSVGGSALGGIAGRYGLGGVGKKQAKAAVAISARLVNTDTGEILAAVTGKGDSERSGTSLLGSGGSWGGVGSGNFDMSSKNFGDTIIGEAVAKAVTDLSSKLENESGRLTAHVVTISGVVADVSGDTLILNIGSKSGVKVGDRLVIRRSTREIKDPTTGKVIRRVEDNVGEVMISEVDESSAVGKFTGGMPAKVGDTVKSSQ